MTALVELLDDPDVETRDAAIASVGRMRAAEAAPALGRVLRDQGGDGDTRDLARIALVHIFRKRFPSVDAAVEWLDRRDDYP